MKKSLAVFVLSSFSFIVLNPIQADETGLAMHRLYNPNSGEHFYTASQEERDQLSRLGWKYEGTGWQAPSEGVDVYRLYNPNAGDHHYTLDVGERDKLVTLGWKYEGVSWKSAGQYPLYRLYNPNAKAAGAHHYSLSEAEKDQLVQKGWQYEGTAWLALGEGQALEIPATDMPSDRANNVSETPTYYSQRDPRWASRYYGKYNMDLTGCVPTVLAMILSGVSGQTESPVTIADYMYKETDTFNKSEYGTSSRGIVLVAQKYGLQTEVLASEEALRSALEKGYYVAAAVGNSIFVRYPVTHEIVLKGYENGMTMVYDPYNSANNHLFSLSEIYKIRSTDPMDNTEGSPFILLKR